MRRGLNLEGLVADFLSQRNIELLFELPSDIHWSLSVQDIRIGAVEEILGFIE